MLGTGFQFARLESVPDRIRHSTPGPQPSPQGWGRFLTVIRWTDSMERIFAALTLVGMLGVIAIVIWILMQ